MDKANIEDCCERLHDSPFFAFQNNFTATLLPKVEKSNIIEANNINR